MAGAKGGLQLGASPDRLHAQRLIVLSRYGLRRESVAAVLNQGKIRSVRIEPIGS